MARVRNRNTEPEMVVRRLLHRMGFRFRLHRTDLPGTPDIVLPKYGAVILVHGCFWHRHPGCPRASMPATNSDFWREKFRVNVERDRTNLNKLTEIGWRVFVVWECETRDRTKLESRLRNLLPQGE